MRNNSQPPSCSGRPPEYRQTAATEYLTPGPEFAPLPPEFDQHGGSSDTPARKKRRSLRYFMLLPLLALLGILFVRPAAKASALPEADLPSGTVVIDLARAGTVDGKAYYAYTVYTPIPSLDATQEQIDAMKNGTPWPVSVYAEVMDAFGRTVTPTQNPDVWESSRALFDYEIDITGLQGDLTLTLLAVYTEQGEQRQTKVSCPLEPLSAEPSVSARLEVYPGGDVDFTATFLPPPGSSREYNLRISRMGQMVYSQGETIGLSLVDDPKALPITGDSSTGYSVHHVGGSAANSLPEEAELSVYAVFEDLDTGEEYEAESNRVSLYGIRQEADPAYPLGNGTIVINVFNDTTSYEFPDLPVAEDGYRTLLDTVTIPEAEFESYALPSAYTPEGYDFAGWVVHVGGPLDPGAEEEENVFAQYNGDPPPEIMLPEGSRAFTVFAELTKQDVEKVPPGEDGVRYVNVHAVWIKQEPREARLLLNDGYGETTAYDMMVPMASEGYLYLCNYPIPQREGYEFDGWYDEDGNRVEMLVCFFSFTPVQYDAQGNFAGYDWNGEETVTLTAHWK